MAVAKDVAKEELPPPVPKPMPLPLGLRISLGKTEKLRLMWMLAAFSSILARQLQKRDL